MSPHADDRDEDAVAAFLGRADHGLPPPDRAFLDRLRETSTEAFRAASARPAAPASRRRSMFTGLLRMAAASVAAAVLVAAGFFAWFGGAGGPRAFGQVLDKVAAADAVHLRVTHDGRRADVWARGPRLRLDEADGTYQIGDGARLWKVDEKANRAVPGPSMYFHEKRPGLYVLDLVGVSRPEDQVALLDAVPAERVERDGRMFDVYRADVRDGAVRVEAVVDVATGRLDSLTAKAAGAKQGSQVTVVAYGVPAPDERFAVRDTLTVDGRVGQLADSQGVVAIKPVLHERWTPIRGRELLKPGDWVRTDVRGANAARLRLVKQTSLTLGPGSLVEVETPTRVRVLQGEFELAAADRIELVGPDGRKEAFKGLRRYRVQNDRLLPLDHEPPWLKGFKGTVAGEPLGSLVARVDGRNVPLSVGYHKVTVDVRDQIARTVIEESFVNHTDAQLEGEFFFPLPADASVSGFGMWIGNELVEADVVEKQRAREIYEIIRSERRDPGLLEWEGGNIFKARVWPIFPQSEKRVKISYTQVLPLEGGRYRYSYPLQSEMLQQHPLRELSIDVRVHSAVPLQAVSSPTHATRTAKTEHAAHVEFSAQEYTPDRDFEVVVELAGRQPDLVVIPHRRGDDGYLLVALTPPDPAAGERDLLPDGEPLDVLVLADTSASMDAAQRGRQAAFLAALFAGLTPKDTVNLAACDVSCDWAFEHPVPADVRNLGLARQFLADRPSLGWTDLGKAFAAALARCRPRTHVVYVGDGVVTAAGTDAVGFTKRLRELAAGKSGTCHAVATGNSYDAAALQAIAAVGGGSVRHVTGERPPQAVAVDLLREIARPALRDLHVEFHGLQTARVYPETLSNVPPGTQQILVGRYLPQGGEQAAEVVVTGRQGDRPVQLHARFTLANAEEGNSFIPRLWARRHLDHLLAREQTPAVRDEIIALSEEYQVITPYTSFLVLETDADRERFKVQRRFRMRDGERFFAKGRDDAGFELAQQQMNRAGNWRLGLRRRVLEQFGRLGRERSGGRPAPRRFNVNTVWDTRALLSLGDIGSEGLLGRDMDEKNLPAGMAGGQFTDFHSYGRVEVDGYVTSLDLGAKLSEISDAPEASVKNETAEESKERLRSDKESPADGDEPEPRGNKPASGPVSALAAEPPFEAELDDAGLEPVAGRLVRVRGLQDVDGTVVDDLAPLLQTEARAEGALAGKRLWGAEVQFLELARRPGVGAARQVQELLDVFPALSPAPGKERPARTDWPAEAVALARSLLRTERLAGGKGAVEVTRSAETFDPRRGRLTGRARVLQLVGPAAWLIRSQGDASETTVQWCDGHERGLFGRALQLGRLRTATPAELRRPPLEMDDYSVEPIDRAFQAYAARVEHAGKDQAVLVLPHRSSPKYETRITVDTARHVVLAIEHRFDGKVQSALRFADFVEAGGCWWARRVETTDGQGRVSSRTTLAVRSLGRDEFQRGLQAELAGKDRVQFLHLPGPSLVAAKRAAAAGKTTFDDEMVLLLHFAASQQWARAMPHLERAEKLAAGKPGLHWLRDAVLHVSRWHDALKQRMLAEAAELARRPAAEGGDAFFLADRLVRYAAGMFEANEMLALLDALRPVYDRQPAHVRAIRQWKERRAAALQQAGQGDAALRLQKEVADDFPDDANAQYQYAQALAGAGAYDAAYAWLDRVLGKGSLWQPSDEESLRGLYAQFLETQGRYAALAEYLAGWVARNPESSSPYQQYLSALIRSDQAERADALIERWLREGQAAGPLSEPAAARLQAAISQALGQGHNLYTNRIEERWLKPLADAALAFARREDRLPYAERIVDQWQYRQTDEARRVRRLAGEWLVTEIDRLPVRQIQTLLSWANAGDPSLDAADWKAVAAGLRRRWAAEREPETKHLLGYLRSQVLGGHAEAADLIGFLREQLRDGPAEHRAGYARQLFDALLARPWEAKYEDEAFGLLDRLATDKEPAERLAAQVAALYELTDRMVRARIDARMAAVAHPEKLTRTELRDKQAENLRLARTGLADRLRAEAARRPRPLAQWLTIERLYLDTVLERDLKAVAASCWDLLARPVEAQEPVSRRLDDVLRERCLTTLAHLAVRKDAGPELASRLLRYADERIAKDGEDGRWKQFKYRLLVALDRPKQLERELRRWAADDPDYRWRLALGYLTAEQGRLNEAVRLFEQVAASDELGPAAYRTLADWYLALNRRPEHDRSLAAAYRALPEAGLYRLIAVRLRRWQGQGPLPSEVDAETRLMLVALFERATYPANYAGVLQQFYQASHDFRLLTGLADAVVGHTAGRIYPLLGSLNGVLAEIRDEATADELVAHLHRVRMGARTAVDRRALDLLETLVERRAAELQNQGGPHAARALAAMRRAFEHSWAEGEPRLVADLLAGLGRIADETLAEEQRRELALLHGRAAVASFDRLHLAHRLAGTLAAYGRAGDGIALLQRELQAFEAASGGRLPVSANEALGGLVDLLEQSDRRDGAEALLLAQLRHPVHREQAFWLAQRLDQVYLHTLQAGGKVAIGEGQALYAALARRVEDDIPRFEPNHRYALVDLLCDVYRTAHEKKLTGIVDDLKAFAFDRLPTLLKQQTTNYESVVNRVASTVHDLAGPRDGVAFLLGRMEHEPAWLRYAGQDGWSQYAWWLGQWREQAGDLGDLEGRLLRVVTAELRRDLESGQQRSRVIYHRQTSYYWAAQEEAFARVAEQVLTRHPRSSATARHVADYVYWGLGRANRGIEILQAADRAGLLDDGGQDQLVDLLHREGRYAESIGLLQGLVARRPDQLNDRLRLMRAYFRTGRPNDLEVLRKQTDAYFHQAGRWTEEALAALGAICVETRLFTPAVAYYQELIPRHQRTRRGGADTALSSYYSSLAQAYAGLGKTAEAVDAAAGAVVCWGPRHAQRAQALETLKQVLRQAPNLDGYVAALDRHDAETGTGSAVIRKALGQVYFDQGRFRPALVQLQAAADLQPNDTEIQQALLACFDKLGDRQGAIRQALRSVEVARRDLPRYEHLGRRLEDVGDARQAERAYTSVMDVLPAEAESHALLAEVRQRQGRWGEAIAQWEEAARLRSLEPTHLLKLAAAQVHAGRREDAAGTLKRLEARTWPPRFGDVPAQVRALRQELERGPR